MGILEAHDKADQNGLFQALAKYYGIDTEELIGLIYIILGHEEYPEVKDFYALVAKMNKIEIIKVERFFALYTIYSS